MLNTITKIIGLGILIGLNKLNTCANRIDVFYEGGPTLVAEGIDGVELPAELSDPSHDLWDEYDPYVKFVGIRLNLPQELIQDCENEYWKIYDEVLIQELEEIVSTEEKFHGWCDKQEIIDHSDYFLRRKYAYILKKVNANNYFISGIFCKRVKLNNMLYNIRRRNYLCCSCIDPNNPRENYLTYFKELLPTTMVDNKLYSFPTITNTYTSAQRLYIRQDWLDIVGKKAPTTMEEFISYLQ